MFVVFEGIDGSGKTTISNRVAKELVAQGVRVKHLRAEGRLASAVSEGIREFGRSQHNLQLTWQAEFLLYVARDVQLIHESLVPALNSHDVVLADRFLYTPEVLGRYGRRLADDFVKPILRAAEGDLTPDLVILVDVDPTIARARRKLRKLAQLRPKLPSRKSLSGAGLQQRLRRGYLERAAEQPERWVVLPNQLSIEHSVQQALDLIRRAQREGASRAIAHYRSETPQRLSSRGPLSSPEQALPAFLAVVDALIEREPRVAAYLLGGLHGPPIDERRRVLFERAPDAVLLALSGLDDEESHRLRRSPPAEAALALRSLGRAVSSPAGWRLWQELQSIAPESALACLSGVRDELAWQARQHWFESQPALQAAVVASLSGLDDERAWTLRERLLERRAAELETNEELARVLAKSVAGLSSVRAWQLRELARRLAPVSALASLTGVSDAQSWRWRAEALHQAPKVVMATLRERGEPEAWRMRQEVALDCKEALDGLQAVDAAEAWALRDKVRDVWPSTVVKSLATLADGTRGRNLVERQLRAYPDNISLLKHAARIALGLHHAAWEVSA